MNKTIQKLEAMKAKELSNNRVKELQHQIQKQQQNQKGKER
jgi:hypothetical protein